jgi:hypothetical protein
VVAAVVVAIVPALRRRFLAFWNGTASVVIANVDRAWGEWAPVLATRTGANAIVLKGFALTGVTIASDHLGVIVTAIMVLGIAWSFMRVLYGRQNASGPVVPHPLRTAEARFAPVELPAANNATQEVAEWTDTPPLGGVASGNTGAPTDPFGDADTPRPTFGPMAEREMQRREKPRSAPVKRPAPKKVAAKKAAPKKAATRKNAAGRGR